MNKSMTTVYIILGIFVYLTPCQWYNMVGALWLLTISLGYHLLKKERAKKDGSTESLIQEQTKQIKDLKERFELFKIGRK
jgi:hypothetical protein